MPKNCCPNCGSKNLIKNKQRTYDCGQCGAPLLHTWPYFESSIFVVPAILNLPNHVFPTNWAAGISVLLCGIGVVLFFKYRDFYINKGEVNIAIDVANDELTQLKKYQQGTIGVLDLLENLKWVRSEVGIGDELSPLIAEHFNRIGGLSCEEQTQRFMALKPGLDLPSLIQQLTVRLQERLQRYKSYQH